VGQLRALIARATTIADLISAENAVSGKQGELDGLTAQKQLLDDQVALSTLTVNLATDDSAVEDEAGPDTFWGGIESGWDSLRDWIGDAVVWTGKALPWLAFTALIAAVLWVLLRVALRRRRGAAGAPTNGTGVPADAAGPPAAEVTPDDGAAQNGAPATVVDDKPADGAKE
jgi:hypothetical protein